MMGQDFGNSDWSLKPPGFKPSPVGLLTRRELAERFCVSPETTFKWERSGMPCALSDGPGKPSFFRESDVRAWMAKRSEQAGTVGNGLDPREQKELWQARLAEQQHQLRSRELVFVSDVEKVWSAEVYAIRAVLLNLPVAFADRVYRAAMDSGAAGVEAVLKSAVYEALRELSVEGRPLPYAAPPEGQATPAKPPLAAVIRRDAFVRAIDQEGQP